MAPDYGPFAASADGGPASLAALAALIPAGPETWLVERDPRPPIPGTRLLRSAECVQMIMTSLFARPPDFAFDVLTENDAPAMQALAALTKPGPFSTATHRLGRFVGVRRGGALVAMAGERMRPPGYTEISGVCTHPDHRGQGYAAGLMSEIARGILARGETPFLHSYASNATALALYERLGFVRSGVVVASVLTGIG